MLLLRAGAEGASSAGACDVAAVVGHAKAYLIGSPYTGPGPEPPGATLQVSNDFGVGWRNVHVELLFEATPSPTYAYLMESVYAKGGT